MELCKNGRNYMKEFRTFVNTWLSFGHVDAYLFPRFLYPRNCAKSWVHYDFVIKSGKKSWNFIVLKVQEPEANN